MIGNLGSDPCRGVRRTPSGTPISVFPLEGKEVIPRPGPKRPHLSPLPEGEEVRRVQTRNISYRANRAHGLHASA